MSILVISDTHFTDRPNDEYRWGIFDWIKDQVPIHNITILIHCGDVSSSKNHHSSFFTNKLVDSFASLAKVVDVIILRGNHDYIDEQTPYFRFLREIPRIRFIIEPDRFSYSDLIIGLYPNSNDFSSILDTKGLDLICCHQTFKGAIAENGAELTGISHHIFDGWNGGVISGDIHRPQKLYNGLITYVGSPYHIRFSDNFTPRVLLLTDDNELRSLYFPTISKHTIDINQPEELVDIQLNPGDQVKIRLHLEHTIDWEESKMKIKKICQEKQLSLFRIEPVKRATILPTPTSNLIPQTSPTELFTGYCKKSEIDESVLNYGSTILEECKND